MRRSLISDSSPLPLKVATLTLLLPILLAFLVVKVVILPFERPMGRSADEVLRYLLDFFEGKGGPSDWDAFISIPIADPRLEDLRVRAAALDLPVAYTDTAPLEALIAEATALVAERHTAS